MTIETKMTKCLFLIAEKGKWGVKDHLKPLKPVYNGAGWFLEERHRERVEQISHQANMRCMEWPLNGETFDELRRRHKREFFLEKTIKLGLLIDGNKASLGVQDISNIDLSEGKQRADLEQIPQGKQLLEHLEEYDRFQEQLKRAEEEEKIANIDINKTSIVPIDERIKSHSKALDKYRGRKYLGLRVKTISEFNDKMLGLRKLILLASAPNVGKTALTIQLGKEVLLTEPDACLVYVSLEMDVEEIFTRMMLYLSGLNFDTYVLGSHQIEDENGHQNFFSKDELIKIESATETMKNIGNRLQVIDASTFPHITADAIIKYVEELKNKTGCSRAIVVIDYLQVWPVPQGLRFTSDIEADKWRIGEVKKIRVALNAINQDPVIVISEARKPSANDDAWGGDLSDVMGSARGSYTPDAVLLLSPLQSKQLAKLWKDKKMPDIAYKESDSGIDDKDDPSNIKGFLAHHGIAICNLKMPKGRDGMKKFSTQLTFHFHKNKFEPIDWQYILGLAMEESNKDKKKK